MAEKRSTLHDRWLIWLKNQPVYIIGLWSVLVLTAVFNLTDSIRKLSRPERDPRQQVTEKLIRADSGAAPLEKMEPTEIIKEPSFRPAPVLREETKTGTKFFRASAIVGVPRAMIGGVLFVNAELVEEITIPFQKVEFHAKQGENIFTIRVGETSFSRKVYLSDKNKRLEYVRF